MASKPHYGAKTTIRAIRRFRRPDRTGADGRAAFLEAGEVATVPWSKFFHRRLNDGDIQLVDAQEQ